MEARLCNGHSRTCRPVRTWGDPQPLFCHKLQIARDVKRRTAVLGLAFDHRARLYVLEVSYSTQPSSRLRCRTL